MECDVCKLGFEKINNKCNKINTTNCSLSNQDINESYKSNDYCCP